MADQLEQRIERLEAKLDLLISLQRIAHRESILVVREEVLSDKVNAALMQSARRGWKEAGELKSLAAKSSGASKPTVERRIAELVELGALERLGSGAAVSYRATSLFST